MLTTSLTTSDKQRRNGVDGTQCEPLRKENDIMKVNLKNVLGLAALGMTLLATPVPTWAGRVGNIGGVFLGSNQFGRSASGSTVGVRFSADGIQKIGCIAHTLSSYSWTTCYATDGAGRSLVCGSGDWKFLEVVRGMTDSSFIYFATGSNSDVGECTNIRIYHGSDMLK
jgi:hypothetical protein